MEAQSASLSGGAFEQDNEHLPYEAAAGARRSLSIFSRRGAETPEPKPLLSLSAMAASAKRIEKRQMSEKQKRWIKRRSTPVGSSSSSPPQKPKGTILNAVPPAKTIEMTLLEQEMATSPNDEVLSAITSSPVQPRFAGTTPPQTYESWSKRTAYLSHRTTSQQQRESHSRIGLWVNGIAHWDETIKEPAGLEGPSLEEQTGVTPLMPTSAAQLNASQSKPTLSVLIPQYESLLMDRAISSLVQPMPRHEVVSVAPADIVSKFALPPPTITIEEPRVTSPIESTHPSTLQPAEREKSPCINSNHDEATSTAQIQSQPSSASSLCGPDESLDHSQRSSTTSVEAIATRGAEKQVARDPDIIRPPLSVFAYFPSKEGEDVDDMAKTTPNFNKPLPPNPIPLPHRPAPAPPSCPSPHQAPDGTRKERASSMRSEPASSGESAVLPLNHLRACCSLSQLDFMDRALGNLTKRPSSLQDPRSLTLSEAADHSEPHLSIVSEGLPSIRNHSVESELELAKAATVARSGSMHRSGSVRSVMQPPEHAPALPKRSRKREWRVSGSARHLAQFSTTTVPARRRSEADLGRPSNVQRATSMVRRCESATELSELNHIDAVPASLKGSMPTPPRIVIDDGLIVVHGPESAREAPAPSASAEDVLLHILSSLASPEDLFNTALINKGMYRVYKDNEMHLVRTVAYNQSPAAFEFREWCPPDQFINAGSSEASLQLEHTPILSYMHSCRRDVKVIESLKTLILEHCQGSVRRETSFALSTRSHPHAQRFNDAFWRIWCFCRIFGCDKGRDEDVTGQLDWLKGGLLANNQDLSPTMNMNLDFDEGSVLLNPPEYFAQGNPNGLTVQQLYDMIEIWDCLIALLNTFHGQTEQARSCGIFDPCDVVEGSAEEVEALGEWTAYLLTLGPAVVLNMAESARGGSSSDFAIAKANGWTQWSPPEYDGSRTTFLKEPVNRLYEERLAVAAKKLQNPTELVPKDRGHNRVANLAAEIRLSRRASGYMRHSARATTLSRRDSKMGASPVVGQSSVPVKRTSAAPAGRPLNFSVPRPQSPPPSLWAPPKISPLMENRVETFNRVSLQNYAAGVAESTSDRAVRRIVEMGFSEAQAREALRMTDMGDGLRLDRAVDLLLRQRQ
ncbi:hypothetical protein LTR37_009513 [Vermiconidia calcicola]|uniref:Uncharacterized protein n=1 Tax=Vermiconidia calcicola TaxID=1690605 RepID=A0ACC3N831_9PEZI|nr:hypothetical protein LTR37_009513 [Vermiconidia calcicola]